MSEYGTRLGNSQDTAVRMRAADASVRLGTTAVRARAGLRPDGGGVVSVVAGTMNVQVSAFSCWVDAGGVGQVGFPYVLDATATLAVDPGDATLTRVDTVAVVADAATPTTATVQVVKGIPGAGAPALPTYAVPLRDISVPAGTSSGTGGLSAGMLSTDRRVYSVGAGGVLPVAGQTERDALGAKEGQVVYRTDIDVLEAYDGTTWRKHSPDTLVQAGVASVSTGGAGTGSLAITFATEFSAAPVVQATSANFNYFATVDSVTTTGCTLRITHYNATAASSTVPVHWTARPAT